MKIFTLDEQDSFPIIGLSEAIPTKLPKPPLNKSWAFEHIDQSVPAHVKGKPTEAGFNLTSPAHNSSEHLKRELHAINYGAEPKPGVYLTATHCWSFDGEKWWDHSLGYAKDLLQELAEGGNKMLTRSVPNVRTEPILEVLYVAE